MFILRFIKDMLQTFYDFVVGGHADRVLALAYRTIGWFKNTLVVVFITTVLVFAFAYAQEPPPTPEHSPQRVEDVLAEGAQIAQNTANDLLGGMNVEKIMEILPKKVAPYLHTYLLVGDSEADAEEWVRYFLVVIQNNFGKSVVIAIGWMLLTALGFFALLLLIYNFIIRNLFAGFWRALIMKDSEKLATTRRMLVVVTYDLFVKPFYKKFKRHSPERSSRFNAFSTLKDMVAKLREHLGAALTEAQYKQAMEIFEDLEIVPVNFDIFRRAVDRSSELHRMIETVIGAHRRKVESLKQTRQKFLDTKYRENLSFWQSLCFWGIYHKMGVCIWWRKKDLYCPFYLYPFVWVWPRRKLEARFLFERYMAAYAAYEKTKNGVEVLNLSKNEDQRKKRAASREKIIGTFRIETLIYMYYMEEREAVDAYNEALNAYSYFKLMLAQKGIGVIPNPEQEMHLQTQTRNEIRTVREILSNLLKLLTERLPSQ